MNGYHLTDKLRKARRKHTISAGAQALYYELTAINNEEDWSDTFKCRAAELCINLNISERTLTIYREELIRAELVTYKSGKTKHCPSDYSLNGSIVNTLKGDTIGSSIGDTLGDTIGSKIYHQSVKKTAKNVTKTTDVYINKQTKQKNIEVVIVKDACEDDFDELNKPFDLLPDAKKEKNSAQKENIESDHLPDAGKLVDRKELPSLESAISKVSEMAFWRHVCEHYKLTDADREILFKKFYETKEDNYRIRLPTWLDVAKNFYYWAKINQNIEQIQALKLASIPKPKQTGSSMGAAMTRATNRLSKYDKQ